MHRDDRLYLVIAIPALQKAHALKLGASERALIETLRGPHLAAVERVEPYGLDLDDDDRADLAFVEVCIAYHQDGVMCQGHARVAVRRYNAAWYGLVPHGGTCYGDESDDAVRSARDTR